MSRPKSARLRMSLFASSSLAGSSLLAGMGGLVVTMAPGAAMAACPSTTTTTVNAPAATTTTTIDCTGTDAGPVVITTLPTDTALIVNFKGEAVTAGGTTITDATAAQTSSLTLNSVSGTNSTTNVAGAGLTLDGTNKGSSLTLTSTVPLNISGTTAGLLTKATTGATTITQTGTVSSSANNSAAVNLNSTTGAITFTGGPGAITAAGVNSVGVQAISAGGAINVNTGAAAVSSANGDGVYLYNQGPGGGITYTSTGTVTTSAPNSYYAAELVNSGSGATNATFGASGTAVGTTTVAGGIRATSGSSGGLTMTTNGLISNTGTGRAAIDIAVNAEPSKQSMTLNANGSISSTGGSAVRAFAGTNAPISLNFNGAGSTISGAGTSQATATIFTNTTGGATTVNLGSKATPTNSQSVLPAAVTVTTGVPGNSGIALGATGSGNVTYNVGLSIKGNDALGGTLASVTQLAGTAVLNGHVDFTNLTGNSSILIAGESTSTGTYLSQWNLGGTKAGNNISTFGSGIDTIENRGVINIGSTAAPAQVEMRFGGPATLIPVVVPANSAATTVFAGMPNQTVVPAAQKSDTTVFPGLPPSTATPTGDRFWNRAAIVPTSVQNLYQPGTINIVGAGGNLTVTGLEVFTNEGASYLNIRNNEILTDFVGTGGSKTVASAQSFGMNPVRSGTNADYYATSSGSPVSPLFGEFALVTANGATGAMPGLQDKNGIPGQQQLIGGVNLADGDTLDVFATSGLLVGNSNFGSTGFAVTSSRFLVDFDLKTRTADQLWVGDTSGMSRVVPRFNYVAAGTAATYDPTGILFATVVANPATDRGFEVDYQSYFNQKDLTYPTLANTNADQGLYRAFVVYKPNQGATSVTVNGDSKDFSSATPTGGYYLTFMPDTEFYQLASLGSTVQEAVRDTTANFYTRQADLRDAVGDNVAGPWLKISGSHAKLQEDIPYKFLPQGLGQTRTVGNYYTQTTVDITAGGDAAVSFGKGKIVAGAAVGYTDSDVRFLGLGYGGVSGGQVTYPVSFIPRYDENRTAMEGYHLGAYGSYIQDQFFVDGSLSYTSLDLHSLFATLNNTVFSTNTKTLDAEVLSGMRFVTDDVFSVEPVVGLSYMSTEQDDVNFGVSNGATTVTFPKFRSLRPGIGGRVKIASATDLYKLNLGLGVMWWHELKDEGSRVKGSSGGNGFTVADLRGGMDTVAIDTSVNMIFANGLSSFVNVNAHGNQDAYLDIGFSAGARYRW